LGWVLAGPVEGVSCQTFTNLVTTHSMAVDAYMSQDSDHMLDCKLKMFWDLESLGIKEQFTMTLKTTFDLMMIDIKLPYLGKTRTAHYQTIMIFR